MIPTIDDVAEKYLDLTAPDYGVEVDYDRGRNVLYVNVDGITVLRISQIPGQVVFIHRFPDNEIGIQP